MIENNLNVCYQEIFAVREATMPAIKYKVNLSANANEQQMLQAIAQKGSDTEVSPRI